MRASYEAILHRGMLIAKSPLHDLSSSLGRTVRSVFARSGRFSQVRSHIIVRLEFHQKVSCISKGEAEGSDDI